MSSAPTQMCLGDAFWFQEGPGVRKWQFRSEGIKLLNVANITKDGLNLSKTDRHLAMDEVETRYSHFLADEGDLVIASSGISIDADGLLRTRGAFINGQHLPLCMNTSTIRFKQKDGVSDLRFLKHWLDSHEFRAQITREVTGIAQKNFGPSHLKRIKISLPALSEQRRIAAILDKADALRQKRREAIAKLDQLLQSVFLEMFGDPVTNPKRLPIIKSRDLYDVKPRIGTTKPATGDGHLVVRVGEVGKSEISFARCSRVALSTADVEKYRLEPGDTVLARAIGSKDMLGKCSYFNGYVETVCIDSHVMRLRPNPQVCDPTWLYFLLASGRGKRLLQKKGGATAVQFNINTRQAGDLDIPTPPLRDQNRFSVYWRKAQEQYENLSKSANTAENFFSSIQQRAFAGQL